MNVKALNFYCDIETYQSGNETHQDYDVIPYCIGLLNENGEFLYFLGCDCAIKLYEYLITHKRKRINVGFHNALYDLSVLQAFIPISYSFNPDKRDFYFGFVYRDCKKTNIRFYDTIKYSLCSLDSGVNLYSLNKNFKKGSIDYDKGWVEFDEKNNCFRYKNKNGDLKTEYIEDLLDYVKNDLLITRDIHIWSSDFLERYIDRFNLHHDTKKLRLNHYPFTYVELTILNYLRSSDMKKKSTLDPKFFLKTLNY